MNAASSAISSEEIFDGGVPFPSDSERSLREALAIAILKTAPGFVGELTNTTSLIQSGVIDSLGLVNVAIFVEREIGHPLDLSTVDLEREWETLDDILGFIEKTRRSENSSHR